MAEKYNVATCESVAYRSYFVLFVRCTISDIGVQYVCVCVCVYVCVYESSVASAYSFGLATNPNRA